jgi:hypothetical protein
MSEDYSKATGQYDKTPGIMNQVVCVNHSNRPTGLRCSRCNDPICPSCAVLTETGYRCRNCLRAQQKVFTTAKWFDFPLAFVVSGVIAFIGGYFASFLGFFAIFIGPIAGVAASEAVRFVTGRRRSKRLFQVAVVGIILGALPHLVEEVLIALWVLGTGSVGFFGILGVVWQGIFIFLAASTAYYRMSGIRMGR